MKKSELEKLVKKQEKEIKRLKVDIDYKEEAIESLNQSNRLLYNRVDKLSLDNHKQLARMNNSITFNIKKCQRYSDKLKIANDLNMSLMAELDMKNKLKGDADEIPF